MIYGQGFALSLVSLSTAVLVAIYFSPMGYPQATTYASLPITALCLIQPENAYLLVGEGGLLHLFELSTNGLVETVRVFGAQAIHNIHVSPSCHSDNPDREIVVTGGSLVASLTLSPSQSRLLGSPTLYDANDWILKARYHDQGGSTGLFALITANNSLLTFNKPASKQRTSDHSSDAPIRLAQGPKTFLYSADISSSGPDTLILAGGSAFGEIVVWTCHQDKLTSAWISTPLDRIPAHNGSVFGICLSPLMHVGTTSTRLVASCSDDRQIHVRDLAVRRDQQPPSTDEPIRDTGFGGAVLDQNDELIASTWGHQSRIWGVDFVSVSEAANEATVKLVSRGEDATCQIWSLQTRRPSNDGRLVGNMSLMYADRHHSGKNIWSAVQYATEQGLNIISGGADGSLWKRNVPSYVDGMGKIITLPFTAIDAACSSTTLKDYMIVNDRQVLALTTSGDLLLHEYGPKSESTPTWQVIRSPSNSRVAKLSANCPPGIAVVAVEGGLGVWRPSQGLQLIEAAFSSERSIATLHLTAMEGIQPSQDSAAYLVVNVAGSSTALLIKLILTTNCELILASTRSLHFSKGWISTTSHLSLLSRTLIVGSRSGSLAFFYLDQNNVGDIDSGVYIPGIQGSEAITSLHPLKHEAINDKSWLVHILTTGRDGSYAIHEVILGPETVVLLRTVHRSSPPLGPSLEGAHLDITTDQILMYGFRSSNFVVWNETEQFILASIDCGGAHRSWHYRPWMNQHGRFVWTKAGTFNAVNTGSDKPELIQRGGHGREIKSVAVFPSQLASSRLGQYYLVASGAEDTEIRLSAALTSSKSGQLSWRPLAVLRDHTTGLQHLAFSTNKRHLVSAGGAEQLYVWRLSFGVPYVEVGVVLEGKMPRTDDDADVRIMHFCILDSVSSSDRGDRDVLLITAAYSNGKVKLIQYEERNEAGEGSFQKLRQIHFGSFCLTQINVLNLGNPDDGVMITAGTNGYLNLCNVKSLQDAGTQLDRTHVQRVHQNSIQCLQVLGLPSNLQLVVTGGDDNALGLTLQRVRAADTRQTDSHTLLIPRAHAAALTALQVIRSYGEATSGFQATVVTAGNDQKIKVWKIEIEAEGEEDNVVDVCSTEALVARMKVCKVYEVSTFVADISNMIQLHSDDTSDSADNVKRGQDFVVVGVGMEVVRLRIQ